MAGELDAVREAWVRRLGEGLEARKRAHLYRELRRVEGAQGTTLCIEGREYAQFCTNNYLGLANDPEVVAAAREALGKYGVGAGASRLVAGSMELHHELEEKLARFKGTEAALVLPTGFMANVAVLTTFAGAGDRVVSDKLNHASLLDAARYSGAEHRTFPHKGYERAEALLGREGKGGGQKFIVSDSVFSMDGDVADLNAVCGVAERTGALVILDEAHGTGVLGEKGRGVAELQGVEGRVAVTVGTLSKALGGVGGFVAGAKAVVETLVNEGRAFIYTTALPAACSAAALAALRIVEREPGRRERVMYLAKYVRERLIAMGFDCGGSETPIVPVMMGSAERALGAAAFLRERGVWVAAIRPPTVGIGGARLRISLMATHSEGEVGRLLEGMREWRDGGGMLNAKCKMINDK